MTHQLMFGLISTANLCIFIMYPQMFLLSGRLSNLLKSPAQFFTSLIAPLTPSKLKLTFQPTFYSSLPCLLSLLAFLCSFSFTLAAIYPARRALEVQCSWQLILSACRARAGMSQGNTYFPWGNWGETTELLCCRWRWFGGSHPCSFCRAPCHPYSGRWWCQSPLIHIPL